MRGVKVVAVTNDVFSELGRHYITVFVKCEMEEAGAQPVVSLVSFSISSDEGEWCLG